uniref:Platelet endothelial aggregation receptor 1 n=1 Tax=Varanus komodoensis TaxID=61221 RepID=A0A8D2IZR5_VARKO
MLLASLPFCPRNGSCSGRPASSTAPALPCPGHIGSGGPWPSGTFSDFRRVVYKAAYRQAVKVDYRKRFRCCTGYYESSSSCVPHCTHECVHGRCVAPDQCQCEQGWRGADCSSECSSRSWGPDCREHCACANGGSCAPSTGACACPAGYTGPLCQEPCAAGTYGQGCSLDCQCGNSTGCDRETGGCFCSPGYAGPHCEFPCTRDASGWRCQEHCSCQNRGICPSPGIHECTCPPGWMVRCRGGAPERRDGPLPHAAWGTTLPLPSWPPRCREECPVGRYGQDCRRACDCANGGRCFHVDGACLCEAGFLGSRCEERKCLPGLHGLSCHLPCLCDTQHTQSCHPLSGECTCRPGWAGLFCNETCPPGYHGAGCQHPCLCLNGGTCSSETGLCTCPAGFLGEHCSSPCPAETYGLNCSHHCTCQNALACSPIDGSCTCKEGWRGPDCALPCPAGTWGSGCNRTCLCANGAACDPADGRCACTPGWAGSRCQEPCPNWFYGLSCGSKCSCQNADGCDPESGQCRCRPGWTGEGRLRAVCPAGSLCTKPCSCRNGAACSPKDGSCDCPPGFRGPTCQRPCQPGRYGKRCSMACTCANHSACHPVDGSCACPPGWRGSDCSQRCTPGFFGQNCARTCQCVNQALCEAESGSCLCPPGALRPPLQAGVRSDAVAGEERFPCHLPHLASSFSTTCPESPGEDSLATVPAPPAGSPSLGAVAGIVVAAALLLALLVLLLWCRQWQKAKERQHLAVAYAAGRPESAEYAVPDIPASYAHYYSNPSYHTLSPCSPWVPSPSSLEQPGSSKVRDSPSGVWPPPAGPLARKGGGLIDRSYSYTNGLRNYKGYSNEEPLGRSDSSLSSENPYATIKDLPVLLGKPTESSYMEMKSPSRCGTPVAQGDGQLPSAGSSLAGADGAPHGAAAALAIPPSHYDSPKNSHIPCHYDVPPTRHYPPSPPCRRQAR